MKPLLHKNGYSGMTTGRHPVSGRCGVRHSRGGFALLLVLMVLVTMMAGLGFLVEGLARIRTVHHRHETTLAEFALLRQGEALGQAWIVRQGKNMVVSPDAAESGLLLVDDVVEHHAGESLRLRVTVYDGLGGIPLSLAGELRCWPPGWSGVRFPRGSNAGGAGDALSRVDLSYLPRYPGDSGPGLPLATWLMPHSDGRINLSTVPACLLADLALKDSRIDVQRILTARRDGRQAVIGEGSAGEVPSALQLVRETSLWNLCVRIDCGERCLRTWVVCAQGERGETEIVQRHVLDPAP